MTTRVPGQPYLVGAQRSASSMSALLRRIEDDDKQLHTALLEHGALLFRGFSIREASDLSTVLAQLFGERDLQTYQGGVGFKRHLGAQVYTSTEVPARFAISPHNELAFLPDPPRHIAFFCRRPARQGGQTPLVCVQRLYQNLRPDIRRAFTAHGVRYTRTYRPPGLIQQRLGLQHPALVSWKDIFETPEPAEVEQRCARLGLNWSWKAGKVLQTQITLPGVIDHPQSQQRVWFNQAHTFAMTPRYLGWPLYALYRGIYTIPSLRQCEVDFGDGQPIRSEQIDAIHDQLREDQVPIEWQAGDLLVLDNHRILHGRAAYRGPREVLTAML